MGARWLSKKVRMQCTHCTNCKNAPDEKVKWYFRLVDGVDKMKISIYPTFSLIKIHIIGLGDLIRIKILYLPPFHLKISNTSFHYIWGIVSIHSIFNFIKTCSDRIFSSKFYFETRTSKIEQVENFYFCLQRVIFRLNFCPFSFLRS